MKKLNLLGVDIGGTKCAVVLGRVDDGEGFTIMGRECFPTKPVAETIQKLFEGIDKLLADNKISASDVSSIGISCGGPLDSKKGVIMSPPNLPSWDDVHIVKMFEDRYGIKTFIQNDANACALAEWKFGAGRGYKNVVFLTFGTGLGSGLILDGQLYVGTTDNGGEVGHIRLEEFGPVGYGKSGSFEGFCSGGGIAQLAKSMIAEKMQMGGSVSFCKSLSDIDNITAKVVAEAANAGDELAKEIYAVSGRYMGKGLSIIIDMLNPDVIILGSIYVRSQNLLEPYIREVIDKEALKPSSSACKIVPAKLSEKVGDYAALSVALDSL